ncbi:hypothetical protein [Oceaniferula spumae]|uniref:hypothetical protein n=1 Tax=Oceaniferula spumae TaxID=2979115 RepID=UPI003F4F2FBF
MKNIYHTRLLALATGIITLSCAHAETRSFTNTEGKTIEAEVVGVSSGKVSLKLKGGKIYTLPFNTLSEADQTYIKEWYEKNKNNVKPSDFSLGITKKSTRIRVPRDKDKEKSAKGASTKMSIEEVSYQFKLSQRISAPTENIVVYSQIIKRTTTRGDESEDPKYEEVIDEKTIDSLSSKKPEEWESTPESCEDITTKSKTASSTSKEDIVGVVTTVYVGGKELFKEYEPSNFEKDLERIQENNPEIGQPKGANAPKADADGEKKPKKKAKADKKKKDKQDP